MMTSRSWLFIGITCLVTSLTILVTQVDSGKTAGQDDVIAECSQDVMCGCYAKFTKKGINPMTIPPLMAANETCHTWVFCKKRRSCETKLNEQSYLKASFCYTTRKLLEKMPKGSTHASLKIKIGSGSQMRAYQVPGQKSLTQPALVRSTKTAWMKFGLKEFEWIYVEMHRKNC